MKMMKSNPGFLTDDELTTLFCVRTGEFESIIEMLRECDKNSNPHRLVIGPRGSGKTSLLLRVAVELRRNPELSCSIFPLIFSEESYGVTTAGEFWLEALYRLTEQAPRLEDEDDLRLTFQELQEIRDDRTLGKRCLGSLLDYSNRHEKRLILITENLNMMFRDMTDPEAGWQLRQTLQTEPRIILLASATSRFDEIDKPDRAFYDLFVCRTLRPLDTEECAILWENVSGQHRLPEAMRGLRILTGGSPRLLSIVARFGADLSFRDLMTDLLTLIDDLTEYFKNHIEALPSQERRVYLALADLWEPATAREVAVQVRLDTSKCSAQLNRLIERGAVEVVGGGARRKLYYLAERLYNIYYLLRRSHTPKPLIEALIRFMDAYYSPPELRDVGFRMVREASELQSEAKTLHWTAFARLIDLPVLASDRKELLSKVPQDLADNFGLGRSYSASESIKSTTLESAILQPDKNIVAHDEEREEQTLDETLVKTESIAASQISNEDAATVIRSILHRMEENDSPSAQAEAAREIVNEGISFLQSHQPMEAVVVCEEIERQFGDNATPSIRVQVARALNNKGIAFARLGRSDEELACYDKIVCQYGDTDAEEVIREVCKALFYKGVTLNNLGRLDEEVAVYDEVVNRYVDCDIPIIQTQVTCALVYKGKALAKLKRRNEELVTYDDIVRIFGDSELLSVREQVAFAMFLKGVTLSELDRLYDAIVSCDQMVERFGDSDSTQIVEHVAKTIYLKGVMLGSLDRPAEGLAAYDEVVHRYGDSESTEILEVIARTLIEKATLFGKLNQIDEELGIYDEITRRFGDSKIPIILEVAANAAIGKIFALGKCNRLEEAIAVCEEVAGPFSASDTPQVVEQAATVFFLKGEMLSRLNRPTEAVVAYDEVVQRFGNSSTPEILEFVAGALINKARILNDMSRLEEAVLVCDDIVRRFGSSEDPAILESVAHTLYNKGGVLIRLNRIEEAIAVCEEIDQQFTNSDVSGVLVIVAQSLNRKGGMLSELSRPEEALAVCNEIVQRFGDSKMPAILEVVARALLNKSSLLGKLNRLEEGITVCEEIAHQFIGSDISEVLEVVAQALMRKGVILVDLNRPLEAVVVFDEIVRRFGGTSITAILEEISQALLYKATLLIQSKRYEEAIAVCDDVTWRFGDDERHVFHVQIAQTLVLNGAALIGLDQVQKAKMVWEEVLRRFGSSEDADFLLPVSTAMLQLADIARKQGQHDETITTIDQLFVRDIDQASHQRCEGLLIRAQAFVALGDTIQAESDIEAALALLPDFDYLLGMAIDVLIDFTVLQGPQHAKKIIQASPSVEQLVPFTIAIDKELGNEPRVAREIEEVAEDIRRDLENRQKRNN